MISDHAGFEYKGKLIELLRKKGFEVVDYGTYSDASCDYPEFAHALGNAIENKEVEAGIAMCGTGNGMAITLNKHQGVRAGLAWNSEIGRLVKAHNHANVLVMPARFISQEEALAILEAYLNAEFEGGRHQNRINKIPCR